MFQLDLELSWRKQTIPVRRSGQMEGNDHPQAWALDNLSDMSTNAHGARCSELSGEQNGDREFLREGGATNACQQTCIGTLYHPCLEAASKQTCIVPFFF